MPQSTYEDVARDTNRGHTVAAVGECFHLAKDAGFKVGGVWGGCLGAGRALRWPMHGRAVLACLSLWLRIAPRCYQICFFPNST